MPMILVIDKVDRVPFVSGELFFSGVFRKNVHTCAVSGKVIADFESAVIEVRGLEPVLPGGHACWWTTVDCKPGNWNNS